MIKIIEKRIPAHINLRKDLYMDFRKLLFFLSYHMKLNHKIKMFHDQQ
jgi:hypothetical protein